MKKSIILTLFTCFALALSAQSAKSILNKTYATYEKSSGIQFDFTMTTADAVGNQYEPQKGTAYVKGNMFKLEMSAAETWFNGKTQWVWMKDLNEVNVSNPTAQEVASISPMALLSMYKQDFLLKKPLSKTVNGRAAYIIEMTPTSKHNDFKQIVIAVDRRTYNIVQLQTTMQSNMHSIIDIKNYDNTKNFANSMFVFNKQNCQDIEIIDLR